MLVENPAGNYTFIRGIGPFSAAVHAQPGSAIVRAAFRPFVALEGGYARIERHLRDLNRPISALCGMQLRIRRPFSREGFDEFNRPYIERLRGWGLDVAGANPVTRTNVAYELQPVAAPMLASFFYTIPSAVAAATWVMSGVPEITSRDGGVGQGAAESARRGQGIVAPGDTSPDGLRQKTACVLDIVAHHLAELKVSWADATTVNLYTVHDMCSLLAPMLIPAVAQAAQVGITWHYSRPPVTGLELEIDAWSVAHEEIIRS
jgi:hypothetical protein